MTSQLDFARCIAILVVVVNATGCSIVQALRAAPTDTVARMQLHNGEWYDDDKRMVAIGKHFGSGKGFGDLKRISCLPKSTPQSRSAECEHIGALIKENYFLTFDDICIAEPIGKEPGNKRHIAWTVLCHEVLIGNRPSCVQVVALNMDAHDPRKDILQIVQLPEGQASALGSKMCGQSSDEGGGEGGGFAGQGTPRPEGIRPPIMELQKY